MRPIYSIGLFLLVSACGVSLIEIKDTYIAPELLQGTVVSIVDEFHAHCLNEDHVQFVALTGTLPNSAGEDSDATCTKSLTGGHGMVFIQIDKWLSFDENQRKWLVSHELLHCEYGLKHDNDSKIMFPMMPSKLVAEDFTWKLVEDLCRK
jgi:hypothetical protein